MNDGTFNPAPGWLKRQAEQVEKDLKTWPYWLGQNFKPQPYQERV